MSAASPPRPCPICGALPRAEAVPPPPLPFCSARCRTIDLGHWLAGDYRIVRPIGEDDVDDPDLLPAPPRTGGRGQPS